MISLPTHMQKRPKGPAREVTTDWLEDVRKAMKRENVKATELAKRLGVSTAATSDLLTGKLKQTRLMAKIHEVLNMAPIDGDRAITDDDALRELLKAWADLSPEKRAHLLNTARLMKPGA